MKIYIICVDIYNDEDTYHKLTNVLDEGFLTEQEAEAFCDEHNITEDDVRESAIQTYRDAVSRTPEADRKDWVTEEEFVQSRLERFEDEQDEYNQYYYREITIIEPVKEQE